MFTLEQFRKVQEEALKRFAEHIRKVVESGSDQPDYDPVKTALFVMEQSTAAALVATLTEEGLRELEEEKE